MGRGQRRRCAPGGRKPRLRPGFEALEERQVPTISFGTVVGIGASGPFADLRANAEAEDSAGDIVVVGSLMATAPFNTGGGAAVTLTASGNRDAYIAKFTPAGALIWAQTFAGQSSAAVGQASAVAVDASGNIEVAGSISGTVVFGTGGSAVTLAAPSRTDAFVAKLNSSGGLVWAVQTTGAATKVDSAGALVPDGSGGAYVAGSYMGSMAVGSTGLTAVGGTEAFAAHVDSAGHFAWADSTSGSAGSVAGVNGMALDPSGRLVMAGYFANTVNFNPAGSATLTGAGSYDADVWVLKGDGSFAWAQGFGGSGYDQAGAAAVDPSGNIYVTGAFSSTVNFAPSGPPVDLTARGIYDVFVLKLSPAGATLWAGSFAGSNGPAMGDGLGVDPSGRVVVSGWFVGTLDFDPGAGTASAAGAGDEDVFVASLDADGNYLGVATGGGSGTDTAFGLAINGSGAIAIAGIYNGPSAAHPGVSTAFGSTDLGTIGTADIFVAGLTESLGVSITTPNAPALEAASDSGASGSDGVTNVTDPTFDVSGVDPGSTVQLLRDGVVVASRTGAGAVTDPGRVPDGAHLYTAREVGGSGTLGLLSNATAVTIDTAPPASIAPGLLAADDSGAVGDGLTDVGRPRLAGTAEAGATIRLYVAGALAGTGTAAGGSYTILLSSALADGTYSVTATATDLAGNTGAAGAAFALTIDTTPPAAPAAPALLAADDSGAVGDGLTDVNRPRLTGAAEPGATVRLFIAGALVGSGTATGGAYTIQITSALADGTYSVTATATDAAGNVGAAGAAFSFRVDATAPAAPAAPMLLAADDSGAVGDGVTGVTRPRLTGTAESGSTVRLFIGGSVVGTGTATGGSYTIQLAAGLADGTYLVTATATDAAGNSGAAGQPLTLTIDTKAPAAPVPGLLAADDSGTPGDGVTDVPRPRLSGPAEPGSTVRLFIAGSLVGTGTATGGVYTIQLASALADGAYSVTATATDAAGNTSAVGSAFALTIDTTPPAAPARPALLAADDSGAFGDGVTDVSRPRITGTAVAGSTVRLLIAGAVVGTGTATGGSYTILLAAGLADGTYSVTATATDLAGNTGAAGAAFALTIDATAPAAPAAPSLLAADDSGAVGDGVTDINKPRFTGTAEAGSTVRLFIAGALAGTATASGGSYTIPLTSAMADGTYSVTATATDAAGNTSAAGSVFALTIDTKAPAAPPAPGLLAADDSGTPGDGVTNVGRPRLTGTAEAGSTVVLSIAGSVVGTGAAAGGTYTIQVAPALANGTYRVTATATDAAGNASAAGSAFVLTIAAAAPAAPSLALVAADDSGVKGDGVTDVHRPRVAGVAAAGSLVQLLDARGDVVGGATASGPGGSYTIFAPTALAGTVSYRVRAVDAAGNAGPASAPLTFRVQAVAGDYDGDGKADVITYDAADALWSIRLSTTGATQKVSFGAPGASPVVADYDGDGKADLAVYVPSTGQWLIRNSSNGSVTQYAFGGRGDVPVPADYNAIGRAEPALYRPSTAQWIVYDPADGRGYVWTFGFPGKSLPVPGEFAGYGAVDLAVYEPGSGDWYSVNTTTWALVHASFGLPGDVPVASDYDGDGRTDVAVYRPSTAAWYISQSSTGATRAAVYGSPKVDQPVPLDYDGDGQSDLAIYLASGSGFALLSSQSGASQFPIVGRAGVDIAAQMTWSYLYANVIRMATIRTSAKPALAIEPAATATATASRSTNPPPPQPSPSPAIANSAAIPAVIKGAVVPQMAKARRWTW